MHYTVQSTQTPAGPIYYVVNPDGVRIPPNSFDCERSAQAFADYLNQKEKEIDNYAKYRKSKL